MDRKVPAARNADRPRRSRGVFHVAEDGRKHVAVLERGYELASLLSLAAEPVQ